MSPSALNKTTEVISIVCSLSLSEMAPDVKALEEQIIKIVQQTGREFYAKVFAAFQQRWLEECRGDYTAVRWRTIDWLNPFGLLKLPVRVVPERGLRQGGYCTLSKALLSPKATRLLSPWKAGVGSSHLF
jgi:putative lipoic acid-binding regulatory protein